MSERYALECDCGEVKFSLTGEPKVRAFCHCNDCRELLKIPYHSVTAWEKEQLTVDEGADQVKVFQHPDKRMKRYFCAACGETLFNSNSVDWRLVSLLLIRKCNGGDLPEALQPQMHIFYASRIVDIDDALPKHD